MATTNQIKFYRLSATAMSSKTVSTGAIWFNTDDKTIQIKTATGWDKYAGKLNDAQWDANKQKLTISKYDGSSIELDFSDIASGSSVNAALDALETKLQDNIDAANTSASSAQAAADAAQADVDAVEEKLGDGFSKDSTVTAQLAAVKSTADAAAVKTTVDAALELKADATQVATDIATAKQEAIDAAAADATSKANDAETNAKNYADGLNTTMDARVDALEAAVGTGGSVDDAITAKIQDLDANVTSAEGTQVRVQVVEADGKITEVKVTESATFATAQALDDEIADREADEQAIGARIDALDAENTGRVSVLETKVAALASATHFLGVKDSLDDVASPVAGDIVIVGDKEYVYDDVKGWVELGDVSEEQNRLSKLETWKAEASQNIADLDAEIDAVAKDLADNYATDAELQALANGAVKTNTEKIAEIEGQVDQNTAAVADYNTRIEALEDTAKALGTTYVKVSDYSTDKSAFEQKHTDLQGEIDAAEDRIDVVEGDINTIKGEQTTQNSAIEAAAALGQQGIDDAAAALDEAQAKVKSVTGDADVNVRTTDHAVSLSLNKATSVAEGDTKAVTSGAVYDAICWVEFE